MNLRSHLYIIGVIIYVLGMFPLFYLYQYQGDAGYGVIDLIATFGAFLVMAQAFVALFPEKNETNVQKK